MIKKIFLLVALLAPICVMAQQKIAIVDSKAVFDVMPEKIAAEAELNALLAQYQAENERLEKEFNQKYADFQALDPATAKSIKARRIQEIQENQRKIKSYLRMVDQDMAAKKAELLDPIKAKIQEAINAEGTAGGYTVILDVSKTPVAFLGADAIDLTQAVKTRLGIKEAQ